MVIFIMFLINTSNIIFTCTLLASFLLCFFVLMYSNIEKLFKQGAIWPIRLAEAILAFILAYFIALGVEALYLHAI